MENVTEKKWTRNEMIISFILTVLELSLYIFIPAVQDWINSLSIILAGSTLGAIGLFSFQATVLHLVNAKLPGISLFFKRLFAKKAFVLLLITIGLLITGISIGTGIFKNNDKTMPTVTVLRPDNNIIKAENYSDPLIYKIYFDDETGLGKTSFSKDFVSLGACTGDVEVIQEKSDSCIVYITNIIGNSGEHIFSIKAGAIQDKAGNKSKEVLLPSIYLYNNENDIDKEAPQISLTSTEYNSEDSITITVNVHDNKGLSSCRIQKEDIILIGCTADVDITNDSSLFIINFDNITYNATETFQFAIAYGVAKDLWGNHSNSFVSDNIVATKTN